MRYAIIILAVLLVGCKVEGKVDVKSNENGQLKQQFRWTDENAAPYANAIFNTWVGADQVCFSLKPDGVGLFLVHFSVTENQEEFRNKWWLLNSYEFILLDNKSYVLIKEKTDGDIVSTPLTDNLVCRKK